MSRNVSDGDFYIKNRKMKESSMKKDLDKVSEGFEVYSTGQQKKNKMNFLKSEEVTHLSEKTPPL